MAGAIRVTYRAERWLLLAVLIHNRGIGLPVPPSNPLQIMIKSLKKIIVVCLVVIVLIGLLTAVVFALFTHQENIPSLCKEQAKFLLPHPLRLLTIYRRFTIEPSGEVVVSARTLFNIPMQTILFQNVDSCSSGSTNVIKYF